jgi:hypothetical protein
MSLSMEKKSIEVFFRISREGYRWEFVDRGGESTG